MNSLSTSPVLQHLLIWFLPVVAFLVTILMGMTVLNVIRLRRVRVSWRAGRLWGYPVFSTVFLLMIGLLTLGEYAGGNGSHVWELVLYGWIGLNWFTASYFMSKRYITDNGIVKNINDPSQTVAWHQINDLVERSDKDRRVYSFFYTVDKNNHAKAECCKKCIRLELEIPRRVRKKFDKIVTQKLGRRFRCCLADDSQSISNR